MESSKLIVNYLPQTMTEKELYSMFITVGPVENCRVMKDHKTGYSYGFGFVTYTKPEDAEKAIERLNGQQIHNKRIKVSYARPSSEDIKKTNLYVTNLPRDYTEDDLEMLFGRYGKIVQKNLLKEKYTKMPRGVAFVRFDKQDQAQNAIRALDGHIPERGSEALSVKVAEEHGKQKAAYFAGWQAGIRETRNGRFNNSGRGGSMGMGSIRGVGNPGGMMRGGRGGARGARNPPHLVSYPIRGLRHDKMHHRFNPLFGGGMPNNGYTAF